MKFNKSEYDQKYARENVTRKHLVFNRNNSDDRVLLEWISTKVNINAYIKQLIREDMAKGK